MNGRLPLRIQRMRPWATAFAVLAAAWAQAATTDTIRIEASTAANEYRIGDPIEYIITVRWTAPVELIRIEPSPALGAFEILRSPDVKQKRLGRGWRQEESRYRLSTFETGEFTIPEFSVVYRDADGSETRVATPPVKIAVKSVTALRPDESEIRDAKPPVMPPFRLTAAQALMMAGAGALLAAIVAALAVRAMRKRRAQPAPTLPPRPIELAAREQLERIAQSALLARGLIKEYFDQVSDVIRAYLGQRYGFAGIVTTTSELLDELRERMNDATEIAQVAEFSDEADMAKFAKWQPDRLVCDHFLETAYRVIEETTPKPAAENRFQVSSFKSQGEGSGGREQGAGVGEQGNETDP